MTTPIYSLPMFQDATSAMHGSPASTRYAGPMQSLDGFWDDLTASASNVVGNIMPSLETVASDFVRSKVGYQSTGQQVTLKDGRVATLVKTPMGTLEALFADGTTEPYDPTKATAAPQTASSLLSGAGVTGATIGVVLGVGLIAWFMLKRKR